MALGEKTVLDLFNKKTDMVREAPAAWSCFFILHIISNPDTHTKKKNTFRSLHAPLEFGGFVQRLHIPDQSHPPCLLSRVAWMMSLGRCSSSSGGSRSAPRSRAGQRGNVSLNDPQSGKHTNCQHSSSSCSPTSLHRCLFLSPHRLIFMIYWLLSVLCV